MYWFRTITVAAMAALWLPALASAITLDATFDSWVRDDGATLADRDGDLVSVWSSNNTLGGLERWGVVEFDLSGLTGTTVNSVGLDLWSQLFGFSDDNFSHKQTAAIISPGVATSTLNWAGITALTQSPLESMGSYDIPPTTADPLLQGAHLFSPGTAADAALVQSAVNLGGTLTIVMMAVEDGTDYRNSWGDGEYAGEKARLWINDAPPIPSRLSLQVDPATGQIRLANPGTIDGLDFDGYVIESESGSLNLAGWNSLEAQGITGWEEVAPSSNALSEVNLPSSSVVGPGSHISLGSAFSVGGDQDLTFQYNITGDGPRFGTVEYLSFGPPSGGDFNGDGVVDGSDFLAWQRGESPDSLSATDLAAWENNFGGAPLVAAVNAVPEPSSALLLVMAVAPCLARCRRA